jgi:hypothetical protein
MNLKLLSVLMLSVIAASALRAQTVDDIIALSQKNTAEDVMLATVEKSNTDFNLSVAEILKLKEANVPNSVISAMLKHHGAPAAAAPAPAPAPAPAAPAPQPAPAPIPAPAPAAPREVVPAGEGQLGLENLDSKKWAYRYEPDIKTIWIVRPTPDDRGLLAASGGTTLRMKSGTYKIRYSGQDRGPSVTVFPNEKSTVMISRVDTPELEALYASIFEHNEKKPGGRLVILRENAPAAGADPHRGGEAAPPPDQRVVEREIVESPVYVAPPPPVIYAPAYYRYPGPYYYPYNSVRFGYYHGGHTRWGVGLGFGF